MSEEVRPNDPLLEELRALCDRLLPRGAGPEADAASPASLRVLSELLDTNAVLLSALDREQRVVFWNRGAERITGYGREEVLGRSGVPELFYPGEEERRGAREVRERALRGEPADGARVRVRTRDGGVRTLAVYARAVSGAGGAPLGVVSVAVDVTESEAAERALRESEGRFRSLFETMTEGVALHRLLRDGAGTPADYVVTNANAAYEAHTGIRREEAIGRRASELYGAGEPPYLDVFARVATSGVPARLDVFFEPMRRHFRILVFSPARDEFATVFEDVTATKELEAALKATNAALVARNEELDAFAHTVAHDLKNPVSAVLGFAEHLELPPGALAEEERREAVDAILRSARKMQEIIDALLLVGESRADVPLAPVDLARVVAESLRGLEHEIRRTGGQVLRASSWPTPVGYPPWVEQVVTNYLSNALKYGGRPPRVEVGAELLGESRVRVWVRDDGRGLTAAERARTFVPFTRLSREQADGHGLGLSIVRRLVERMGGAVGVESEGRPGAGCTFHFTLPRA